MEYFAAVEVDQIQSVIFASDKLKEMVGASYLIDNATASIKETLKKYSSIKLIWSVSGVYKFNGDNLAELAKALWDMRQKLVYGQGMSVTFEIINGTGMSVTEIFYKLDEGIRQQKDSRNGEDGTSSTPYFVPCRILPDEYANFWQAEWDDNEQQRPRALVSEKARIRGKTGDGCHGLPFIGDVLPDKKIKLPDDFDDLTVKGAKDSYMAFIKADGDGLGLMLGNINWDDKKWQEEGCMLDPRFRPFEFSNSIRNIFIEATKAAITDITSQQRSTERFPVLPLILGGEDLWILARRDLALPLVHQIGTAFSNIAVNDPFLRIAFRVSGVEKITLSFGVLFAQKGYPFDQQTKLVNELLKNAKKYRKGLSRNEQEGCVDFLWLDASGRETVEEMRKKTYGYKDNDKIFRLFSHPWTLTELKKCLEAMPVFENVPRRKLYQWRNILRSGDVVSVASAHRWYASLETPERSAWDDGMAKFPSRLKAGKLKLSGHNGFQQGFWRNDNNEYATSIHDVLELMEIHQYPSTI